MLLKKRLPVRWGPCRKGIQLACVPGLTCIPARKRYHSFRQSAGLHTDAAVCSVLCCVFSESVSVPRAWSAPAGGRQCGRDPSPGDVGHSVQRAVM